MIVVIVKNNQSEPKTSYWNYVYLNLNSSYWSYNELHIL